jgi:two-component system chemotaxis response regulator CheY
MSNVEFREKMQSLLSKEFRKNGPLPSSDRVLSAVSETLGSLDTSLSDSDRLFLQHVGFSKLCEIETQLDVASFEKMVPLNIPRFLLKKSVILVEEGEMSNWRMWQRFLDRKSFTIAGRATHGQEAIDMHKEMYEEGVTITLVLFDLHLGDTINAVEAVRDILKTDPGANIMVVSSSHDPGLKKALLENGAKEYIVKPVTGKLFASVLDSVTSAE